MQSRIQQSNTYLLVLLVLALLVGAALFVGTATATPGSGVTSTPIATGDLPEPTRIKFKQDTSGFGQGLDVSRIMVVKLTLAPGGNFGWHQHSGPVWAVVTSGTLTIYHGDDPTCQPHVFAAGSTYFDSGDRTHIGRNEGDEPLEIYATFMLPEGGAPRIDVSNPGICPF